mmetsp:Transcript_20020/g.29694  ORF Transcript_20020/g.29694 Transcript_20020/m.29694 type:complete len:89 (-) Transcript_20020:427-693(-)
MRTSFNFEVIVNIIPLALSPASFILGVVYSLATPSPPPPSSSDGDEDGRFDGDMEGEVESSLGGRVGSFEDDGDNEGVDVTFVATLYV